MITFGHGGNIYEVARQYKCRPSDIIDMSSNINPLIRISLKTPETNRLMGAKLRALAKDATMKCATERIAC